MLDAATAGAADGGTLNGELAGEPRGLLAGERDAVADAAALIFVGPPDLDRAGFDPLRGGAMVIGPSQGRPARARLPPGRDQAGVAAMAAIPAKAGDGPAAP